MGLGGVAIAVPPYVIHPKTAVLGRAGGGNSVFFSVEKFGRLKYSLYFCSRNSKT